MKRRKVIVILVPTAILIIAAAIFLHKPEPSYQGKSLTQWMDEYAATLAPPNRGAQIYDKDRPNGYEITAAFKAMGTNSIPFIFRWLDHQDTGFRADYRLYWPKLPKIFRRILPPPKPILDAGQAGTVMLPAGPIPVPMLLRELRSPSSTSREIAIENLFAYHAAQTEALIPQLIPLLNDANKMVGLHSAGILGQFGPKASNAIPALIVNLQASDAGPTPGYTIYRRAWCANALGSMGNLAESAVPVLLTLTNDPDMVTRVAAAAAIWRISSNADQSLPILTSELSTDFAIAKASKSSSQMYSHEISTVIEVLGDIGPRAKPVTRTLQQGVDQSDSDILRAITNALVKIDPEAVANLDSK